MIPLSVQYVFLKLKLIANYFKFHFFEPLSLSTPHFKTPIVKKTQFPYFFNKEVQLYKTKKKQFNITLRMVMLAHTILESKYKKNGRYILIQHFQNSTA